MARELILNCKEANEAEPGILVRDPSGRIYQHDEYGDAWWSPGTEIEDTAYDLAFPLEILWSPDE